jgi:hypothetical protein
MVAIEVDNQAVYQIGRRADRPLGHHPQLAHLATPAPASRRNAAVSTTTRVT